MKIIFITNYYQHTIQQTRNFIKHKIRLSQLYYPHANVKTVTGITYNFTDNSPSRADLPNQESPSRADLTDIESPSRADLTNKYMPSQAEFRNVIFSISGGYDLNQMQ